MGNATEPSLPAQTANASQPSSAINPAANASEPIRTANQTANLSEPSSPTNQTANATEPSSAINPAANASEPIRTANQTANLSEPSSPTNQTANATEPSSAANQTMDATELSAPAQAATAPEAQPAGNATELSPNNPAADVTAANTSTLSPSVDPLGLSFLGLGPNTTTGPGNDTASAPNSAPDAVNASGKYSYKVGSDVPVSF
jgi:hypothetical protein